MFAKEIKRRRNMAGIFLDKAYVICLAGSILIEISDEWQIRQCYFSLKSMKEVKESELMLVADQSPYYLASAH
jgi:putative transposase